MGNLYPPMQGDNRHYTDRERRHTNTHTQAQGRIRRILKRYRPRKPATHSPAHPYIQPTNSPTRGSPQTTKPGEGAVVRSQCITRHHLYRTIPQHSTSHDPPPPFLALSYLVPRQPKQQTLPTTRELETGEAETLPHYHPTTCHLPTAYIGSERQKRNKLAKSR